MGNTRKTRGPNDTISCMNTKKVMTARAYLFLLLISSFLSLGFYDVLIGAFRVTDMFSADYASSVLEAAGILIICGLVYFLATLPLYVARNQNKILTVFAVFNIVIQVLDNWYRYYAITSYLPQSFLSIYFLASIVLTLLFLRSIKKVSK
jgi:hypothetical protein